jgi:Amt family ammonium transporter
VFSSAALDGVGLPDGVSIGDQLLTQLIGAVATLVWSGVATFVILKLVNVVAPLRASRENENEGLDLALHGESGYSL